MKKKLLNLLVSLSAICLLLFNLQVIAQQALPGIISFLLFEEEEPPQYDYTYFSPRAARVNTGNNAGDQSQPDIAVINGSGGVKDVVVVYTQNHTSAGTNTRDVFARQFNDEAVARTVDGRRFFAFGGHEESWPRTVAKSDGKVSAIYLKQFPRPTQPDNFFLVEADIQSGPIEELVDIPPYCFENESSCEGSEQFALNADIAELNDGSIVSVYSVDTATLARELRVTIRKGPVEYIQKTIAAYSGSNARPFDIDVVATQAGGFAVLWYYATASASSSYYFQIFDSEGNEVISRVTVSDKLTGTEKAFSSFIGHGYGSLAALTENRFAITWVKVASISGESNRGVLTILNGSGKRVTEDTEFSKFSSPSGKWDQMKQTDVAQLFDDAVLVTWSGNNRFGQGSEAFAWTIYGWIATIKKPKFDHIETLAGLTRSNLGQAQIAVTSDGRFTIAFELADLQDNGAGVWVPDSDGIDVNIRAFEVSRTLREE